MALASFRRSEGLLGVIVAAVLTVSKCVNVDFRILSYYFFIKVMIIMIAKTMCKKKRRLKLCLAKVLINTTRTNPLPGQTTLKLLDTPLYCNRLHTTLDIMLQNMLLKPFQGVHKLVYLQHKQNSNFINTIASNHSRRNWKWGYK